MRTIRLAALPLAVLLAPASPAAADIIATDGDPTVDARQLAQVEWVMTRGKVVA